LTPTISLSQLGRRLALDRELQSVLDAESRRFEVRVARLLQDRRARRNRASAVAGAAGDGTEGHTKRARWAEVRAVGVQEPRLRKSGGRGKAAGK